MSVENRRTQPVGMPVIWLACTSCQLVYQPDPSAFESGTTGCPQCGGWTWIAQLGSPDRTTPERVTPRDAVEAPQNSPRTPRGETSHDPC
jgi:hypothetical protein